MEYFFGGLLAVLSLLILWFKSPLKITLAKLLFRQDVVSNEVFDDLLFIKNNLLGKLVSCWICCSFWCSLGVGVILTLIFGLAYYFPIITFFCYPGICYLFKKIID